MYTHIHMHINIYRDMYVLNFLSAAATKLLRRVFDEKLPIQTRRCETTAALQASIVPEVAKARPPASKRSSRSQGSSHMHIYIYTYEYMYIHIYIYIYMLTSPPRHAEMHILPIYPQQLSGSDERLQKSKTPKLQARFRRFEKLWIFGFLDVWLFGCLDFWIFRFLEFWIFGFLDCFFFFFDFWVFGFLGLTVVFPICRDRSKFGFGKGQRLCRYLRCFYGVCLSTGA